MKKLATTFLAATLAILSVPASAAPVCLDIVRIRNTTVPDANHILFHMIDGTTWRNTLKNSCPGLIFNGFIYAPTASREVCENLQTIRVIREGSVCLLGSFSKEPAKAPAANGT